MLFIVNNLPMNGGSTFVLRLVKRLSTNTRVGVFVLACKDNDSKIVEEIKKYAEVYYLKDFTSFKFLSDSKIAIFLPLKFKKISGLISSFNSNVHVMGLFGLYFMMRLMTLGISMKTSVGIYHQNEFVFKSYAFYFVSVVQNYFKHMDDSAIIFFNESSRSMYSRFFNRDFSRSPLLPVGVEAKPMLKSDNVLNKKRIISIGNLHKFKTYNAHIIRMMPDLLKLDSSIEYEIYGDGPCFSELKELVRRLDLENYVFFKGVISYEEIDNVLKNSFAFIGSGTSIVEASIRGIPSIIGIESMVSPDSYGYFSEARGYSYHEYVPSLQVVPIFELLKQLLLSSVKWKEVSLLCRQKALDFSVDKTAEGFLKVFHDGSFQTSTFKRVSNLKGLLSFVLCGILDVFRIDQSFKLRRNQGSIL